MKHQDLHRQSEARRGLQIIRENVDIECTRAVKLFKQERGMAPSCRVGCSHCCTIPVVPSLAEVIALVSELKDDPRFPEWTARAAELAQAVSQEGMNALAWLKLRKPCHLLKDNLCSVYDKRPAACRAYFVFTPPQMCKKPNARVQVFSTRESWWNHNFGNLVMLAESLGVMPMVCAPLPVLWGLACRYLEIGAEAFAKEGAGQWYTDPKKAVQRWRAFA